MPTCSSKELQHSQKEMLWWLNRQLAIMPPKAARWVAEMREISEFVSPDSGGRELFEGAALLYEQSARISAAQERSRDAEGVLTRARPPGDDGVERHHRGAGLLPSSPSAGTRRRVSSRQIELIVPFAAGGGSGLVARMRSDEAFAKR